jgi:hypothetical protein
MERNLSISHYCNYVFGNFGYDWEVKSYIISKVEFSIITRNPGRGDKNDSSGGLYTAVVSVHGALKIHPNTEIASPNNEGMSSHDKILTTSSHTTRESLGWGMWKDANEQKAIQHAQCLAEANSKLLCLKKLGYPGPINHEYDVNGHASEIMKDVTHSSSSALKNNRNGSPCSSAGTHGSIDSPNNMGYGKAKGKSPGNANATGNGTGTGNGSSSSSPKSAYASASNAMQRLPLPSSGNGKVQVQVEGVHNNPDHDPKPKPKPTYPPAPVFAYDAPESLYCDENQEPAANTSTASIAIVVAATSNTNTTNDVGVGVKTIGVKRVALESSNVALEQRQIQGKGEYVGLHVQQQHQHQHKKLATEEVQFAKRLEVRGPINTNKDKDKANGTFTGSGFTPSENVKPPILQRKK